MICRRCSAAIHKHQARREALVAVHQSGDRRVYHVCGECLEMLEAMMGRLPREPIPADPNRLQTIMR